MNDGDNLFRISGRWALASDGIQWILLRRHGPVRWDGVSYVRSTKDILARCMREKETRADDAVRLLDGLPDTFDEWRDGPPEAGRTAPKSREAPNPPPGQINEPSPAQPALVEAA
jgi:hypothetical protein